MIQPSYTPTDYDLSVYALFVMEVNVRRMKCMIENGFYPPIYSDEYWSEFKQINQIKQLSYE